MTRISDRHNVALTFSDDIDLTTIKDGLSVDLGKGPSQLRVQPGSSPRELVLNNLNGAADGFITLVLPDAIRSQDGLEIEPMSVKVVAVKPVSLRGCQFDPYCYEFLP